MIESLKKYVLETALGVSSKGIKSENVERITKNIRVRKKNLDLWLDTNEGRIVFELNATCPEYLHTRNTIYICDRVVESDRSC